MVREYVLHHKRVGIDMQVIDEAKPNRLTHHYNREWCNNFIPRHQPVSKSTANVLSVV